jgi:hypothetical protein
MCHFIKKIFKESRFHHMHIQFTASKIIAIQHHIDHFGKRNYDGRINVMEYLYGLSVVNFRRMFRNDSF